MKPDDIPQEFLDANPHAVWRDAVPLERMEVTEPQLVASSVPPEQLEELWRPIRERQQAMMERIKSLPERPAESRPATLVVGIAGAAGSGKSLVASMIPGAAVVQLADPIYAAIAAMFSVPEASLRSQAIKATPLPQAMFTTPRKLLQTLGTEWGRNLISEQIWILQASNRITKLREAGAAVIAIPDVRFANEARWIRDDLGGVIWHVQREGSAADEHASESGIEVDPRDTVLTNDGTPAELQEQVLRAMQRAGEIP